LTSDRLFRQNATALANPTTIDRVRQALRAPVLRSIPWVLFGAVFLPAVATTAVGIVILALGSLPLSGAIALGVLTLCFAVFVVAGASVTLGLIFRQNRLARTQTEFIANASHELRTPLASIRMYVDTLRMGRVRSEEDTESCLAALDQETARLTALVEQLLDFRASTSGVEPDANREYVSADEAIRDAVAPFEKRPGDGERISLVVEPALPRVLIRRTGFDEALSNLIQNALTHGGNNGEVVITARVDHDGVSFDVRDSGPGVTSTDLKMVFERFHRSTSTTESKIPGFGLGLSIVKRFADGHGGRATVRNGPLSGAIFTIWLPAHPGAGTSPRTTPPSPRAWDTTCGTRATTSAWPRTGGADWRWPSNARRI
jgi:two-component system phosphate regulon sensor histidine kinase PhoR